MRSKENIETFIEEYSKIEKKLEVKLIGTINIIQTHRYSSEGKWK